MGRVIRAFLAIVWGVFLTAVDLFLLPFFLAGLITIIRNARAGFLTSTMEVYGVVVGFAFLIFGLSLRIPVLRQAFSHFPVAFCRSPRF